MGEKSSRAFRVYLLGQGVSNLGDSFRFIAVTILIYNLTGSGLSAALGMVVSTLPGVFLLPFSGVLGDRADVKKLLVWVDLVRFLIVSLFFYADRVSQVYLLLILLSLSDILYGPSRKKFILRLTGRKGALKANSLLAGISGAAYLAGPLAAGILTDRYGIAPAISISCICCILSSILTWVSGLLIKDQKSGQKPRPGFLRKESGIRIQPHPARLMPNGGDFREGLRYCFTIPSVRSLLWITLITGFCTISVNMAFYPFAFDVLRVTAKGWSLMITVYYGTNLIAMLLVKVLDQYIRKREGGIFYTGLAVVSIVWALYAFIPSYVNVLVLQFIEGAVISVCGILLAARLQVVTDGRFMARASGISELFADVGKLAGMGCSAVLTGMGSFSTVFLFSSAVLFLFSLSSLTGNGWHKPGGKAA